jgi:hypothetical protein
MANPSLYKPRRTRTPDTGPEVDTSVNYLLGGIVVLALLFVSLFGMIGYSSMQRPLWETTDVRARRVTPPEQDIGPPVETTPTDANR